MLSGTVPTLVSGLPWPVLTFWFFYVKIKEQRKAVDLTLPSPKWERRINAFHQASPLGEVGGVIYSS